MSRTAAESSRPGPGDASPGPGLLLLPGEREMLEVEVGQWLADLSGRVPGYLVAVRIQPVNVRRDDIAALVEVEPLHLVQDLFPHRRVTGRVRLVVELRVLRIVGVRLVEWRAKQHRLGHLG